MKLKTLTSLLLVSLIIISCDDSTDGIGTTLTNKRDQLDITTDTFNVTTKSIAANAVLSRNISGYIGKFKDPETETDITADFMTQFGVLENFYLPELKNIVSKEKGLVSLSATVKTTIQTLIPFRRTIFAMEVSPLRRHIP